MKMTKTQIDNEIRSAGIAHLDTDELIQIGTNLFIGKTEVDDETRFYEIKVTVKKDTFTQDDLEVLIEERRLADERNRERAEAAAKKREKDSKRRAEAAAKKKEEEES